MHGGEGDYLSCGHGTVVKTPDGRMFYMCHAYLKGEGFYAGRQPVLQEMEMTADHWVFLERGNWLLPNNPCLFKTTIQQPLTDFEDHFTENKLKVDWTWNYPYSDINIVLKKESYPYPELRKDNQRGTALCLRPQSSLQYCERKSDSR